MFLKSPFFWGILGMAAGGLGSLFSLYNIYPAISDFLIVAGLVLLVPSIAFILYRYFKKRKLV